MRHYRCAPAQSEPSAPRTAPITTPEYVCDCFSRLHHAQPAGCIAHSHAEVAFHTNQRAFRPESRTNKHIDAIIGGAVKLDDRAGLEICYLLGAYPPPAKIYLELCWPHVGVNVFLPHLCVPKFPTSTCRANHGCCVSATPATRRACDQARVPRSIRPALFSCG